MAIITKEITEWVKMKRKPSPIERSTDACRGGAEVRRMSSDATIQAEKKKLRTSKRKQELAPSACTMSPETAGLTIWDACMAWLISALTLISPPAGASVRMATVCAGI